MWFSITENHLPVPFAAVHAPLQAPCPLHALLTMPPAPCICHPSVALTCCMRHLAMPLSPHTPLLHMSPHRAFVTARTMLLCTLQLHTPPRHPYYSHPCHPPHHNHNHNCGNSTPAT